MLNDCLKGHGNEADFLGFLQKLVPHESLTLSFGPFQFLLRIRGDIRIRKTFPAITDTGSRQLSVSVMLHKSNAHLCNYIVKRLTLFPSPARMSLTKLSLFYSVCIALQAFSLLAHPTSIRHTTTGIFKLLRSPRIDSKKSIPSA
jgi:hypothetical protein